MPGIEVQEFNPCREKVATVKLKLEDFEAVLAILLRAFFKVALDSRNFYRRIEGRF